MSLLLETYADCGEDILELVDECDEARVVDIDPVQRVLAVRRMSRWSYVCISHALGFVCAIAG